MKDFYITVLRPGESTLDYWIRLKSIDAVDVCLRRRGKCVDDPCAEAVVMFISYCPDPDLAVSFKLKPAESWTAAEVQEQLDNNISSVKHVAARSFNAQSVSAHEQSVQSVSSE